MQVKVKLLNEDAKVPTKATPGSACYDIYTTISRGLWGMEVYAFPTGLAFELPGGYEMEIRPRSGLALEGLVIANSPGTLDSDYRGELKILLQNLSGKYLMIEKGERIAQVKINKVVPIEFKVVEDLTETKRGEGGFGSSGL